MKFSETSLAGAWLLDIESRADERGFFARSFCAREFEAHGLVSVVAQCNLSFNHLRGTLRGMHYQVAPAEEPKLVRCSRGAIHDVIVDMRPGSPTYLQHFGVDLTAANHRALYVPALFAHGYLTLEDATEVSYQVGEFYTPGCERGLRWDDPALGIPWPITPVVFSEKDAAWPLMD